MRYIIGAPPSIHADADVKRYYDNIIRDSMFLIKLYPAKPHVAPGPQLFVVNSGSEVRHTYDKYVRDIMNDIGGVYTPFDYPIHIAALADTAPSESFSASYDQSFLAKFGNVASTGMAELTQMFGSRSLAQLGSKINESLKKAGQSLTGRNQSHVAGMIAHLLSAAGYTAKEVGQYAQQLAGKFGKTFADMLAGYKINFPKVWTGASYSPNYSFTIRLYNPDPSGKNIHSFSKYILQPLLMLLLFVVPISKKGDEIAYNWPFFCHATAPGMFKIRSGAVTDISVVKGGDNNAIAYTQIAGIVDVRITIIDLYEVMVACGNRHKTASLEDYLDIMKQPKPVYDYGEGCFKEEEVALNTMSAVSLPDRSPTRQINPSQQLAYNMLQSSMMTNTLNENWPPDVPAPSSNLQSYLLSMNTDPDARKILDDYPKALATDKNSILNDINNLPDKNQTSTPSVPTVLASLNINALPKSNLNPVASYMSSNPTSSIIVNSMLAEKTGTVNRASSTMQAKQLATTIVHTTITPDHIKKHATQMLAETLKPKIANKCKEEIPSLTDSQLMSISKGTASTLLASTIQSPSPLPG